MTSRTSLVTSAVYVVTGLGYVLAIPLVVPSITERVILLTAPVAVFPAFAVLAWLTRPDYGEHETVARHVALVVLIPTAVALLGGGVTAYLLYPLHWLLGYIASLYTGFILAIQVANWSGRKFFPTSTLGIRDQPVDGTGE